MRNFLGNMVSQARVALDPRIEFERPARRASSQQQSQSSIPPQQPQQQPVHQNFSHPQQKQAQQQQATQVLEQTKSLILASPRLLQTSVGALKEVKYASIDGRRTKALAEDVLSLVELLFDHSRANEIEISNFLVAHGHLDSGETARLTQQALAANTRWTKAADEMAVIPEALTKANSETLRAIQLCQTRMSHAAECAQRRQATRQQAAQAQKEFLEQLNIQMFQQQRRAAEEHHLVMSNLYAKFGKSIDFKTELTSSSSAHSSASSSIDSSSEIYSSSSSTTLVESPLPALPDVSTSSVLSASPSEVAASPAVIAPTPSESDSNPVHAEEGEESEGEYEGDLPADSPADS